MTRTATGIWSLLSEINPQFRSGRGAELESSVELVGEQRDQLKTHRFGLKDFGFSRDPEARIPKGQQKAIVCSAKGDRDCARPVVGEGVL